jgi:hypothetical protein
MCAQCMATAAAAVGGATGLRAWLAAKGFQWLSATVLRRVTIALGVGAVLIAGVLSGSGA